MRNTQICHVISSMDKNYGGTAAYVQLLSNELVKYKNVSIITKKSNSPLNINKEVNVSMASTFPPFSQIYSCELKYKLNRIKSDLFHGHGLWQYPVHAMARVARNNNIPYIISTHGMLEPWPLNDGKFKKKIALLLYQNHDLAKAACIHATVQTEADNIRKLGFENPIAIIPIGIDLSEFSCPLQKQKKIKYTLLFLSVIQPKKGLELLIEAWENLPVGLRDKWQIKIAGNGKPKYINELQQLIEKKRLTSEISIIGPKFGRDKINTYQDADLFVLPTYNENFGIVVAEALACGIPVITTQGTPWEDLNTCNAGWWIEIGTEPLISTLCQAMQLSPAERRKMGQNGRQLVFEKYSVKLVTLKMVELYDWLFERTEKPSFVY
jgi:glycosyltransferase involved in cell wall biosynthesis